MSNTINLISLTDKRGVTFDRKRIIKYSQLIETALESEQVNELEVRVSYSHLLAIHNYIEHHGDNETIIKPPLKSNANSEMLVFNDNDKWDIEFLQKIQNEDKDPSLKDFSIAVNYMIIPNLLTKVCGMIALEIYRRADNSTDINKLSTVINDFAKGRHSAT